MTKIFTSEVTNHGNNQNGLPGLPLMSEEGASMAARTAPADAKAIPFGPMKTGSVKTREKP